MPKRAPSVCQYPGCKALAFNGRFYCPAHITRTQALQAERQAAFNRTPDRKHSSKLYNGKAWQAMRASQLRREPLCRTCSAAGRITVATEVDHITPHRNNAKLFFDRLNLQALCKSCHSAKTAREVNGREGRSKSPSEINAQARASRNFHEREMGIRGETW